MDGRKPQSRDMCHFVSCRAHHTSGHVARRIDATATWVSKRTSKSTMPRLCCTTTCEPSVLRGVEGLRLGGTQARRKWQKGTWATESVTTRSKHAVGHAAGPYNGRRMPRDIQPAWKISPGQWSCEERSRLATLVARSIFQAATRHDKSKQISERARARERVRERARESA